MNLTYLPLPLSFADVAELSEVWARNQGTAVVVSQIMALTLPSLVKVNDRLFTGRNLNAQCDTSAVVRPSG
jgi:hypothetical protein